jgi:pyridoxine 5-phosphate synthase
LSLEGSFARFEKAVDRLQSKGIPVSLFIAPSPRAIQASARLGAVYIEIHTGAYSQAFRLKKPVRKEFLKILYAAKLAVGLGLKVNAGHGLTYQNTAAIAAIPEIEDLNTGHNIVARASLVGMEKAVREMLAVMRKADKKG